MNRQPPTEPITEQPTTQAVEQTEGQTIVGMGGAVKGEFEGSGGSPTAAKFRLIDQERQKRGEQPIPKPTSTTDQQTLDTAIARLDKAPHHAELLVKELNKNPRPIDAADTLALVLHRIEVREEYYKSARDAAQAYEDSKKFPNRLEDMAAANARTQEWSNRLTEIEQAMRVSGSQKGLALRANQIMVNEDFTLANLEMQKRADNGWRELTPDERAELKKVADEYKAKNDALEKRLAEAEKEQEGKIADAILKQAQDDAKKYRPYSEQVFKIAEQIVASWDTAADAARARIKARMARTSAGVDPTVIYDLAVLGRSYLGHAALDAAKFTARLVEDVGEWAREHADEARKKAEELIAEEGKKSSEGSLKKQAIKKITKQDSPQAAIEKIKDRLNKDAKVGLSWQVRKLARLLVESGVKDRDALVDAVWGYLKPVIPEITRRQTMDILSGYGSYKLLPKDQVSKTLRDLKGQLQAIAKLEDMAGGEAPRKTGIERRVPSDEERRLNKQVEEAKRRGGYRVTNPEIQLRTALESRKTYFRNQISDLEAQIAKREKFVKQRTPSPTDTELETLKARRDELKSQFDEIFAKPEMTDAERLAKWKDRTRDKISELEEKVRVGDISTRPRPKPIVMDKEAVRLQYDLHQIHRGLMEMRARDRRKQWSQLKKIGYGTLETMNTARALQTSYDLSAVLRQGGFVGFGHPIRAAKSIGPMLRAFASKEAAFRTMNEIRNRENAPLYEQSGLYLADYSTKLSAMEENYMSRFAEKIPGVGASQRAYTTFLNKLRSDSFDAMAAKLTATGKPTIGEAKLISNFINVATGRGKIGVHDNVAVGANAVFFAPRYVASRFQLLAGQPIWSSIAKYGDTGAARKLIAAEYARFLAGQPSFMRWVPLLVRKSKKIHAQAISGS